MHVTVCSHFTQLVHALFGWGAFAGFSPSLKLWRNDVALAISVEGSWGDLHLCLLEMYLGVELPGHKVDICSALADSAK